MGIVTQNGPLNANSSIVQVPSEIANKLLFHILLSDAFPAIDAVLVLPSARFIIFAHAIVSTTHPIKNSLLKDVYEQLVGRQKFDGYKQVRSSVHRPERQLRHVCLLIVHAFKWHESQ